MFSTLLMGLVILAWVTGVTTVTAQPPGTMPPPDLLRSESPWLGPLQGIRPDAFIFQDESGTPVVMPRMSFEEIDRLRKRDRGYQADEQFATLERLNLQAQVRSIVEKTGSNGDVPPRTSDRGELRATALVRLDVSAIRQSGKPNVVVNLGFASSNLLGPATVRWYQSDEAFTQAYVRLDPSDKQSSVNDDSDKATAAPPPNGSTGRSSDRNAASSYGYQLVLPTTLLDEQDVGDSSGLVAVELDLSQRVESDSPRRSRMRLSLPVVSTTMEFEYLGSGKKTASETSPPASVLTSLDVSGGGREVIRRVDSTDRFVIECGGGDLLLEWSTLQRSVRDAGNLLEVESETTVQWETPSDPLTMDVRLSARNLRGPLGGFDVNLPEGSVLLSPPEITKSNATARETIGKGSSPTSSGAGRGQSDPAVGLADDSLWEIQINDPSEPIRVRWNGLSSAAPSAVQMRLQIRQVAADASANAPWTLSVPQVIGSIGHRGSVAIRTSDDHRLRWRPKLGIDAVVSVQADEKNGELSYPFRFSQNRFELPIWLSSKQEQLRLTADVKLEVTRRAASITMEVAGGGSGIDPTGLRLELGRWRLIDIRVGETPSEASSSTGSATSGRELDITTEDSIAQWQVETSDGKWPDRYRITAELAAETSEADPPFQSMALPRLLSTESSTLLTDVSLSVADGRRETWLMNLAASPLWQRVDGNQDASFRLINLDSDWVLQGSFASRTLELDWESIVRLDQSSDHWWTQSSWKLESSLDLEGRLRFSLPSPLPESPAAAAQDAQDPPIVSETTSGDPRWKISVNGEPAIAYAIQRTEANVRSDFTSRQEWEIVSPELGSGKHQIELAFRQPILPRTADSSTGGSMRSAAGDNGDPSGSVAGVILLPTPLADRVIMKKPLLAQLPLGIADAGGSLWRVAPELGGFLGDLISAGEFEFRVVDEKEDRINEWSFPIVPDFPVPIWLRSRVGEEQQTEIPRSYLRSLIGKQFRHEHLLASVTKGSRVRLGLPASLKTIRVEARLDGQPISYVRDTQGLRIDLPLPESSDRSDAATEFSESPMAETTSTVMEPSTVKHLLDVRIWIEIQGNPWYARIEPMIRLPVGSGLQYWQLVVPNDSHLFWAASQSGRAMRWQHDRLKMQRLPAVSDDALIRWTIDDAFDLGQTPEAGSVDSSNTNSDEVKASRLANDLTAQMIRESLLDSSFAVPGNRYLFFAGNSYAFSALTVSRTMLWLVVGGLVLLLALAYDWLPALHHPLAAFALAIGLAGIMVVAPDGVVLTAQLVMISLSLVAVFYAISAIAVPRNRQRVLTPRSNRGNASRSRHTDSRSTPQRPSHARNRGRRADDHPDDEFRSDVSAGRQAADSRPTDEERQTSAGSSRRAETREKAKSADGAGSPIPIGVGTTRDYSPDVGVKERRSDGSANDSGRDLPGESP